ncbi:hypothetical protein DFH28DRAFT_880873 [Melampsora americana]|nr:hypothetical protein DFH28DRAFT_880873 [Melampsora americana]
MKDDQDNDPEPQRTTVPEVRDLLNDMTAGPSDDADLYENISLSSRSGDRSSSTHPSAPGIPFADLACSTDNSSTDPDFENQGWGGVWVEPLEESIVFDREMLSRINALLPQIHIPTWIARPCPVLGKKIFQQLVQRLNSQRVDNRMWIASTEWCLLSSAESDGYSPVVSSAQHVPRITREGLIFSTASDNLDNSIVHIRSLQGNTVSFGQIIKIFHHRRVPVQGRPPVTDTWMTIKTFPPIPMSKLNPFRTLDHSDMQAHLRLDVPQSPTLVHIDEIVAHCGWISYGSGEVTPQLKMKTIALVSLDR